MGALRFWGLCTSGIQYRSDYQKEARRVAEKREVPTLDAEQAQEPRETTGFG